MKKPAIAIIQARMSSSRLPGKVMKPLAGTPIIWHIYDRASKCRYVDKVIVATSMDPSDDPLSEFCLKNAMNFYRGSLNNVLSRFTEILAKESYPYFVRITGDCPLIHPEFIDNQILALKEFAADMVWCEYSSSILEGQGAHSTRSLFYIQENSKDERDQEHVGSPYYVSHPEEFKIVKMSLPEEFLVSDLRLTVDEEKDYQLFSKIYDALWTDTSWVDLMKAVEWLRTHPEIASINKEISHKKLNLENQEKLKGWRDLPKVGKWTYNRQKKQVVNILFRCDGSHEIGMGHVVRCLAIAEELYDRHQCNITFAMRSSELGIGKISKTFPVITPKNRNDFFDYEHWFKNCVKETRANVLILDVRDGLSRTALRNIKQSLGIKIVTIDDPEDKRLEADLAFYPPVPQVKRIDWTGFTGELYVGWEWVILRKEFSEIKNKRAVNNKSSIINHQSSSPKILVTMGGSDPQAMTIKAVEALEMLEEEFETVVVLGAGFQHKKQLYNLLSGCKHHFDVRENVQNMAELISQNDLAVASFGVTAYELAAMGVPAIHLCLTEDHAKSASAFVEEGMAILLGVFTHVSTEMMAGAVSNILNNKSLVSKVADPERKHIDGQGMARISCLIIERVETGNE
jgi:spore coat polysaccharide biosynthesis protein SpsF (cytidylyltransferase family)/spore coat polysaccharide biosynthesis predicted glycosyltransferase SpsG